MIKKHRILPALLGLATALSVQAAEIAINDLTLVPNGTNDVANQQTEITPLNGGNHVLPNVNGTVVYTVTTFTFGTGSDAHIFARFNATGGQNRLGVRVQDNGFIDFISSGDPGRTTFNLNEDQAGKSVTLLIKQHYDTSNDSLRATLGTGDDTLMTVWVNPDGSDVEGSGITAGDMHTLWNSNTYRYFTQTIENQGTPGSAGNSRIENTVILTGADATWANALAIATGGTPPTNTTDPGTSTVSASPAAVPADGTTTSTVTVTLRDSGGSPVSGKDVSLAGDGSAIIETADNTSDANGVVTFTVRSGTVGMETFTATDITDSTVVTDTATVDFQEVVVAGPVDAGTSGVTASPTSVPANGVTTSTVTVTLRDSNGVAVAGEDVTLAGSPAGATISPAATQTTDANGVATFAVSSSTIGQVTFTATSATDSVTVTQTAAVDFADPAATTAFNVTFLDEGQANVSGLLGVVGDPGEFWNQGIGTPAEPVTSLVDTTGTVTSSVNVSGLGTDGRTLPSADLTVFNGTRNVFGKGSDVTLSITGLTPDAAYDLFIYSLSHNASPWGDISNSERAAGDFVTTNTVTGNGQSQFLDNGMTGTSDDVFVPNGNYVAFESIIADGSGNISVLVDAYDGDGDRGPSSTRLQVSGLQIRPATGASVDYNAWAGTHYPGLGGPDDDDDNDGLGNDYERIFGLDPTDPSSVSPYQGDIDPATGAFAYTRRTRSLANLNYKVWYSTDLENWFEDNAANQLVQSTTNDVEVVGVTIDPTLLSEPQLFVQVRVFGVTTVDPEPSLVNAWGSGSTLTVLYSEPMNPSSAGNPANYTVIQDGGGAVTVTAATPSSDGGSVTLTLASPLGLDTGYTVTTDRVTSGTGQALGSGVSRQFTTWDDNPNGVKVFVVAGQSNMVGFGETERGNGDVTGAIGSLRYRVLNNGSFPDYDYTSLLVDPSNASSAYRTRSDVKVWYRDGGNGQLGGAIKKGDLGPPFMGRDNGKIGPEFAFGQILGDYYSGPTEAPVLIVKCSWGGRDLAEKFRPPSAVADRGGQVGEFFNATIDYTRQVLANLDTEFPVWAGQGYEIVGFGWHQGYNDRINAAFSAEYKDNLPDLIEDLRAVFNKPDLPVVIASTGMDIGPAEMPPYAGYSAVEKAQLWVAGVPQPANVLSTDTRPFMRTPAQSPANQGFHWNQNGETYFDIGKAMGDNMVNLLTP